MSIILWIFDFGYLMQHLGTILQIQKIEAKRSIEGVCVDTQILFLIGTFARTFWITDTMLKDFFLTYIELLLSYGLLIYTLYLCLWKYNDYTVIENLNRKEIPIYFRWYVIFAISLLLSYFYFPGNDGQAWDLQMLVSLNIYAEAGGLLPQIIVVNKEKDSSNFSQYYIIFLSFSRICRLMFWVKMYSDDNSFIFLMIADFLHSIMVSGFIYSFFKNLNKLSLPTINRDEIHQKKIF